ncbi:dTDP-4-dehydrorhamnose reductase [Euzebyella saccharophila]|uniref:dTDP-4-dehydrorhamnose reductase n=1 Tax=Euzebyella saccharophila TaxID=679664 RepID=A0ABV8JS08_9FLAO|nr:dTDP-4-dehydrorhamnose reductase [Euzebyella saccharophila]
MLSVLVTGANGQLGKSIQELQGDYPEIEFHFKNSGELDISNENSIAEVFANNKFDYCINCAAYTNVEIAEREPQKAFLVNSQGTANIARECEANGTILIHISTDYVFDGAKGEPYTILDKTNPINVYGASKLEGEVKVRALMKRFFIVRTSWLYSEFGNNFYKTILAKAQKGEPLSITDAQTGCPTHADNLAKYILSLIILGSTDYGLKHFTDGVEHTWYSFAIDILKKNSLLEKTEVQKVKNYRTFARRPVYSVLESEH